MLNVNSIHRFKDTAIDNVEIGLLTCNRENTYYFTTIVLHNIWMLQLAEKFYFLKSIIGISGGSKKTK